MNWLDEILEWHADDLVKLGFIKSQQDWEKFSKVMSDTAMNYIQDREVTQ